VTERDQAALGGDGNVHPAEERTVTDTPTAPTDTTERPDWACVLHRPPQEGWPWRQADRGYRTCGPCLDRLRAHLAEVRDRYHVLDARPGAQAGDGTRGAPGFGSKPPANVHIIAMTDSRSSQTARMWRGADGKLHAEDEHPPISIQSALDTLAWDLSDQLDIEGPDPSASVDRLARWVDVRLDLVTRHGDATLETARVLRQLTAALRPVTGEPRARRIGSCPEVIDTVPDLGWAPAYAEDPGVDIVCGQSLYAPPRGDTIRCRSCHASWPREQWLQLGQALQATA
jgi:hypothetical protein